MKSGKEFRGRQGVAPSTEDSLKRAQKLQPNKKNGKERHSILNELDEEDETDLDDYKQRESVLDYLDDDES